jgi:hypothetical protein
MKLLDTLLSVQRITLRVGRSALLLGVAWVGPAQASPVEAEMRSYQGQEQPIAKCGFLLYPSCFGPPSAPATVRPADDDHASVALPAWQQRLGTQIDSYEMALRVLYCCWRN